MRLSLFILLFIINCSLIGGDMPKKLSKKFVSDITVNVSLDYNIYFPSDYKKSKDEYPELKIEVEVENESQLDEALFLPIERIMLDNWETKKAFEAVKKIRSKNKHIIIEISGGINKETIRSYALCLPDIISLGSVTHSAKALDISLEVA